MTEFRVRYVASPVSGHVYCRVFAAADEHATGAALGNLTIRKAEWDDFRATFSGAKFVEEEDFADKAGGITQEGERR